MRSVVDIHLRLSGSAWRYMVYGYSEVTHGGEVWRFLVIMFMRV